MRTLKQFFRYSFYLILTITIIFALGVIWPLQSVAPVHTTTPIVITDVSIVDVQEGQLIPHQSVLINNQRIIAIAQTHELSIPEKWQWLEDVNKTIDEDPSPQARKTYRDFYKKGLELTGSAHKAGVKILVGTDYIIAGATVHDELQQLVMAGLSPAAALQAATTAPAEYFSLTQDYGQVKEGLKADVILLDKNPLDDIRHSTSLEAVIFNGNLYDRNKLDHIENIVEERARSWTIGCKILWEFIKNPGGY